MKIIELRVVIIVLFALSILISCTETDRQITVTPVSPTAAANRTPQSGSSSAQATVAPTVTRPSSSPTPTTADSPTPTAANSPTPTTVDSSTPTVAVSLTPTTAVSPTSAASQTRSSEAGLQVLETQPIDGAVDVKPYDVVTVFFNQPVVILGDIEAAAALPQPLTFEPPVEGTGAWLDTATYQFTPGSAGFRRATEYTARIAAGLTDSFGEAVLAETVEWRFITIQPTLTPTPTPIPTPAPPLVTDISPADKTKEVSPWTAIAVSFNRPMYRRNVEDNFSLVEEDGDEPASGTFVWRNDPEGFIFTPAEPLTPEARYRLEIPAGTQAEYNQEATPTDVTATFTVSPDPFVRRTYPASGGVMDPGESILINFNVPMDASSLEVGKSLLITPTIPVTRVYTYWENDGTALRIELPLDFSRAYSLTLGQDLSNRHGQPLKAPYSLAWQTEAQAALLFIESPGFIATYNAYTDTAILLTTRNVNRVDLNLYRLPLADLINFNQDNWGTNWEEYQPPAGNLIEAWQFDPDSQPNQRRLHRLNLGPAAGLGEVLPPGLYYLEATVPEQGVALEAGWTSNADPWERQVLVVSKYNVTLKESGHEALAWVTDLQSGRPVGDQPVTFLHSSAKMDGQTAEDGVAQVSYGRWRDPEELRLAVVGDADNPGDNFALGVSRWNAGIHRYEFRNVETENSTPHYSGHFYTHRALYRPGETVYFKGIIRANDDAHYTVPEGRRQVTVVIQDEQGNEVYNEDLPLNAMGTVHDTLELAGDAGLGFYHIQATYAGQTFFDQFEVSAYRPPEFALEIQTDRARYAHSDPISVTVSASFFFGGPVSDAQVRWTLLTDDFAPRSEMLDAYDFVNEAFGDDYVEDNHGGFGPQIAAGEGVTGPDGRFTFQVTADIADRLSTQLYTFDIVVTDINNQEVAGQARVLVHKGDFLVGLQPEQFVGRAAEENRVNVLVVDWAAQPVADQPVQVVFAEFNRYSVQRLDPNQTYANQRDAYYWETVNEEVPVFTTTVTTDANGLAVAGFAPERGGIYKIFARATDADNDVIRTSAFTWISGDDYINWGQQDNDRFELVADQAEYTVGDTARILIPHPFDGPTTALVTLERGHIYDHFVIDLPNNSTQLTLPVTEEMLPNMYVSVVVMKGEDLAAFSLSEADESVAAEDEEEDDFYSVWDVAAGLPSFRLGYVNLAINPAEKALQIDLTPDKPSDEIYQPRETVTYDVQVTNARGEPVQAEMSLALVDQAVLSLAPEKPGRILQDFWHSRGLAVETASGLTLAIDRFNRAVTRAKGGGGGCVDCGGFEKGFGATRLNLLDTALWIADFTTDENGQGRVEATLPDNLTTWTLTGIGVTGAETLVGEESVDIVSAKPLLVRPVTPRFFVVGDEAQVGVIVQNTTAEDLAIEMKFEAEGATIGDWRVGEPAAEGPVGGQGGVWTSQGEPAFNLAAGRRLKVEYQVAIEKVAAVRLTMGAKSNDDAYGDALSFELPVYRESTPETVATAGQLDEDGTRTEGVALPDVFDPTQGDLVVDLDPSLAAGMRDGLTYLEHFPYECTEQTVSRFLPNAVTYRAYKALDLENPELADKLPDLLSVGLQRLYQHHHFDGGWGWWADDDSHPIMTAYVLQGLIEAERAGFSVNQVVVDAAAAYLEKQLLPPAEVVSSAAANQQAYLLYVLAEAGQGDLGRATALFEQRRDRLDLFGRAYLAMTFHLLDDKAPSLQTLLNDIHSAAISSATGTHWEETQRDPGAMNTDTRTTAIIIAALARIDPDHPVLPRAVRWLMSARSAGGYWRTTQETAWSIMGLTDWMVASGELAGNYNWQVTLNEEGLGEGSVGPDNIDETVRLRVEVADLLTDAINKLVIERDSSPLADETPTSSPLADETPTSSPPVDETPTSSPLADETPTSSPSVDGGGQGGVGRLYYAAYLTYYKPVEEVTALDRGVKVSREYRRRSDDSAQPVLEAALGDLIEVHLIIEAPNDLHYVLVEDPLPAGAEAVNTSLATTSLADQAEVEAIPDDRHAFTHTELRDEKAVLFATYLPRGTYRYIYLIRASLPGRYHVIPTHAEEMYFPEVFGRSDGAVFTIGE